MSSRRNALLLPAWFAFVTMRSRSSSRNSGWWRTALTWRTLLCPNERHAASSLVEACRNNRKMARGGGLAASNERRDGSPSTDPAVATPYVRGSRTVGYYGRGGARKHARAVKANEAICDGLFSFLRYSSSASATLLPTPTRRTRSG